MKAFVYVKLSNKDKKIFENRESYGVLSASHSITFIMESCLLFTTSMLSSLTPEGFMCAYGGKNVCLCVCSLTCYLSPVIIKQLPFQRTTFIAHW